MPRQLAPGRFERIRARLGPGGRLGVALWDTDARRTIGFDADGHYPLGSTFKVPLVAAVLAGVDRGARSLDQPVPFGPADVRDYAPVVRRRLSRGRMELRDLCHAALTESDNSAADLLLREIGGAAAFNAFVQGCGDAVTRLDRPSPEPDIADPGDRREGTTPAAMAALVHSLLYGDILSRDSQGRLRDWMNGTIRLRSRLAADLPASPESGREGSQGGSGEISLLYPTAQPRLILVAFISGGDPRPIVHEAAHASVVRAVYTLMRPVQHADPPEINYPVGADRRSSRDRLRGHRENCAGPGIG